MPRQILVIAVIAAILFGCSQQDEQASGAVSRPYDSIVIALAGADSLSVFDILTASHQVDYVTTAAGVFVKAIDSLENNSEFSWVYSVNDSMPPVAADRYITGNADSIKWYFRRMRP